MSDTYSKIRFIGFAIPTTPADLVDIGNPNGPGAVAGTYLGHPDSATDLAARVAILKNAVDIAQAQLPTGESGVINVFVAPEFYFHGRQGPYVYSDAGQDPADTLKSLLTATFTATEYPNWTFLCGTVVTTQLKDVEKVLASNSASSRNAVVRTLAQQWQAAYGPLQGVIFDLLVNFIKTCHSYPNCEVRNRCVVVSNIPIRTPQVDNPVSVMSTEKYFVSNEDFLLYDTSGRQVITEQMTAYRPIDLSTGDAKQSAFDAYAIFRQNNIDPSNPISTTVADYGVEICLDHSDVRLRRNIDNEPAVIGGIHVQLIPSCGMQISLPSVATDADGLVFNCDGQYALTNPIDENLQSGHAVISDVDCLYANYTDPTNAGYGAHTQLARVQAGPVGGDPSAPGSSDATLETLQASSVTVVDVTAPPDLRQYFAGGAGQIHIYGLSDPFVLYP